MVCVAGRVGLRSPVRDMNSNEMHNQAELARLSLTGTTKYQIKLINGEFVKVFDKEDIIKRGAE